MSKSSWKSYSHPLPEGTRVELITGAIGTLKGFGTVMGDAMYRFQKDDGPTQTCSIRAIRRVIA